MADSKSADPNTLLARLEQQIARSEQAAEALVRRHRNLRSAAATTLEELDGILGTDKPEGR